MERKVLIFIAIILTIAVFTFLPFDGGDNIKYFLLSRSIQEGQYRSIWLQGQPLHVHYPPVFPGILSLFPTYLSCKIVVFFMFLLFLVYAYWLFKELELPDYTFLLLIFSPLLLTYSHWVLSEIPYLLFSTITLFCLARKEYPLALTFALISYLTRSVGISLVVVVSVVVVAFLDKREYRALFCVWGIILSWMVYCFVHGGGYIGQYIYKNPYNILSGYVNLSDVLQRITLNLKNLLLVSLPEIFGCVIFSSIIIILIILGVIHTWRDRFYRGLLIYMCLFLTANLLLPNIWLAGRYYLPLLPVFCIFAGKGLQFLEGYVFNTKFSK
jgi:hypothetical protein